MTLVFTYQLPKDIHEALLQAREALEILRRGHGVEVGSTCYPALNSVRAVLDKYEGAAAA